MGNMQSFENKKCGEFCVSSTKSSPTVQLNYLKKVLVISFSMKFPVASLTSFIKHNGVILEKQNQWNTRQFLNSNWWCCFADAASLSAIIQTLET